MIMRLIDADKFEVVGGIVPEGYDVDSYLAGNREILEMIDNAPTVDAVEVVRCKDCLNCGMKASIKYDGFRDDVRLCMLHGIAILPDDYCSGGVNADAEVNGDA